MTPEEDPRRKRVDRISDVCSLWGKNLLSDIWQSAGKY